MSLSVLRYTALYSAFKYMLTSPGYKLNALVPLASVCPCSPFLLSFDRQGFFRRGYWSQAELKTLHEFSVHIWVGCGQLIHLGVVEWDISCIVQSVICHGRCSIQSPSLDARMSPSIFSIMSMYVERLLCPPLGNLM